MTIKELSAAVDIQPQPLGNVERGLNAPSARVIKGISQALGVPIDALFADSPGKQRRICEAAAEFPFPILPDGRPISSKNLASGDAIAEDFLALEDICEARKHATVPLRFHVVFNEAGMSELAAAVRRTMEIGHGVVFDYFELLENCGFRIVMFAMRDETCSFSYFDPVNENAFLLVDANMNGEKQLFRLIFETGLVYLRGASGSANQLPETIAANARKFAAFFLMPETAVRQTVGQLGVKPEQWSYELLLRIKHRFGVSAETFLYRLNELALIEPELSEQLKKKIHEFYAQTNYQEPDSSRRIVTPNGRLWDLLTIARMTHPDNPEVEQIARRLKRLRIPVEPVSHGGNKLET